VETLKVVIAMIAKPFSLNKHSNQNTCKRNTGWMERRGGRERQRDCEESLRSCAFMGSTPAQNSYCTPTLTPTSLPAAKETALDQCWAVLTFVRTGRFRFLHHVMRTWSLFQSIYIYIYISLCGLVRTEQVLKIFIFSKLNHFSNMVILAYIITINFRIRFSLFLEITILLFFIFLINFLHLQNYFKIHGNLGGK
jgi:hypothetical protein